MKTICNPPIIALVVALLCGCSQPEPPEHGVLNIQSQPDSCVVTYTQPENHGFALAIGSPENVAILGVLGGTAPFRAVLEPGDGGPSLRLGGQKFVPQHPGSLRLRESSNILETNGLFAVADITPANGNAEPVFIGLTDWATFTGEKAEQPDGAVTQESAPSTAP